MEEKGKILIIDDNEDVLFALNMLLEPYMQKIKVTTQPARIEHFMRTFQPDVVLLDMNFRRDAVSGQEGFECLEQILNIDPQAVVIFMTAYSDTEKAVRAISQADMLIIGGTSLVVYPAAGFIDYFRGKYLVVINKSEMAKAVRANLSISAPIGEILGRIKVK